jgi:hypothetical protein
MPRLKREANAVLVMAVLAAGTSACASHLNYRELPARDAAQVESRWQNGHILVKLWVGARPVWMILDSGASNTFLRRSILDELGEQPISTVEIGDIGPRRFRVSTFSGATLSGGGRTIEVERFGELPEETRAFEGLDLVDGIVGYELFDQCQVEIDPARRTVRLLAPDDSGAVRTPGTPIEIFRRVPLIATELRLRSGATATANLVFDLGSNVDVQVTGTFSQKHDLVSQLDAIESVTESGLRTDAEGLEGRASGVRVGRFVAPGPMVAVLPDIGESVEDSSIVGTVGLGVLRRFVMRLEYSRRLVRLVPVSAQVANSRFSIF